MKTLLNFTLSLLISSAFISSQSTSAQQHLSDERTLEKLQSENIRVLDRFSETYLAIDDIGIVALADNDLDIISFNGSAKLAEGDGSNFVENIHNKGTASQKNNTKAFDAEALSETSTTVEIGEGDIPWSLPFSFFWNHSLSQTLYYPDEIGFSNGYIFALAYSNNFSTSMLNKEITIWMGETTDEDLINGWIDPSTLQLVFDGMLDFPVGVNDIIITLDQPYNYTGGNLVIYSHKSDSIWVGGNNFRNSFDGNRLRTRQAYRDFTPFDPLTPPDASSGRNHYPNITLFLDFSSFGSIEGTVTDGANHLEGVNVTISNSSQSALTNAQGEYSLPALLAGEYSAQFELFGYETLVVDDVVVEGDSVTILNAVMTPIPQYTVIGTLQDSDGSLIGGATVNLSGYANYEVLSDENGVFSFSSVYESIYTLNVVAFGYQPFSQTGLEIAANLDLGVILLEIMPASFDVELLDFGMVPVMEARLMTINITNNADALLMLFSFNTGTPYFYALPATWAIQPGATVSVPVIFTAPAVGVFLDNLVVEYFYYAGSGTITLPLKGEGMLLPPSNLTAEAIENTINLNWLAPGSLPNMLRFGNGQTTSTIGTSEGIYEFAARFTSTDLIPYYGKQLDAVGFYIHSTSANLTLNIYTGEQAENLLLSLPLNGLVANEWNDINLPAPVLIENIDYLWLSYEINSSQFDFIAGIDGGPGVAGSGDLLRINGTMWTTLSDYGFSNNWNIRGLLSDAVNGDELSIAAGKSAGLGNYPENTLLGYNIYRDSLQLNTSLITGFSFSDEIEPGQSFLYGVTAVYGLGESMPATVSAGIPQVLTMPAGWEFTVTSMPHNIHIPETLFQIGLNLQPGDMLGVFYDDNGLEKCAGAIQWNGTHKVLTAYGNDPNTFEKDGFNLNETISWKLFRHQQGSTHTVIPTYDHDMPHYTGLFSMLGLSMLESIELGTVGISQSPANDSYNIYPNPTSGFVNIEGLKGGERIRIFDSNGRLVFSSIAESGALLLRLPKQGLYLSEIQAADQVSRKKIVVY